MNKKHTPGPWTYSVTEISGTSEPVVTKCTVLAQGDTVASLTGSREANARLIAAAPELYQVLWDLFNGTRMEMTPEMNNRVLDLLRKAGGAE